MRSQRARIAHAARRALTATGTLAVLTGITVAASPAASASTVLPEDPKKNCSSAVHGVIGDTVAITGESVADVVNKGADRAKKVLVVSELAIWDDHLSDVVAGAGTIKIGTVPDKESSTVSGEDIAAEVVKLLEGEPGLGFDPEKTLSIIEDTVAESCGLTVFASNYSPSTTSATPPQQSGRSGESGGTPEVGAGGHATAERAQRQATGDAMAPRRDYGGVPAVPAPSADLAVPPDLRYPPEASLPQKPPSFDILGGGSDMQSNDRPRVREAGNANALAAPAGPERVQLPMLLAVVALAMVTAALVRTWVMRRTTSQS